MEAVTTSTSQEKASLSLRGHGLRNLNSVDVEVSDIHDVSFCPSIGVRKLYQDVSQSLAAVHACMISMRCMDY